jgi:hypothetical protein
MKEANHVPPVSFPHDVELAKARVPIATRQKVHQMADNLFDAFAETDQVGEIRGRWYQDDEYCKKLRLYFGDGMGGVMFVERDRMNDVTRVTYGTIGALLFFHNAVTERDGKLLLPVKTGGAA